MSSIDFCWFRRIALRFRELLVPLDSPINVPSPFGASGSQEELVERSVSNEEPVRD